MTEALKRCWLNLRDVIIEHLKAPEEMNIEVY
jgi:hypothetical protein